MPIQQVPYMEPIVHPLDAGWRSYFQGIWNALKGWKRSEFFVVNNPMTGTVLAGNYRVEVHNAPAGASVDYDSVIHITPVWTFGNQPVVFEAKGTSAGQIAYTAHNYSVGGVNLSLNGPAQFYLLVFSQK